MLIKMTKDAARLMLPVYEYSDRGIHVVYAGYSELRKNYFGLLPFKSEQIKPSFLGMKNYLVIPRYAESHADIVFAETGIFSERFYSGQNGFILPDWADMYIDIPGSLEPLCCGRKTTFHEIRRLINKYDLTYKVENGREKFQHFYRYMYLPYLIKRYDRKAWVQCEAEIVQYYKGASLLSVFESGRFISAVIFWVKNDCLYMHKLGIIDGEMQNVQHGAIGTLYYFAVTEALTAGCTRINIGGTRPFLNDGVTHFKLGLSARFHLSKMPYNTHVWFGSNPHSEAAKEFLDQNPFVYYDSSNNLVVPK